MEQGEPCEANKSLNFHTPKAKCSVKYNDLDAAVHSILKLTSSAAGGNVKTLQDVSIGLSGSKIVVFEGKTDVKSTFRLIPLLKSVRSGSL